MQLLRKIAFPISLIYAFVVHLRNYFFDIGLFNSNSFETPIICVGNLSVGGTGKTPMIDYLVSLYKEKKKVAVLSRGYKRKSKGYVLTTLESTVEDVGDEPLQIFSKHSDIAVAVDSDRRNGIQRLQKSFDPDMILLDDAFQHRKVKPDLSILLTAFDNLYMNDWYLPTGDLRDSKREAKRADIIVVTKCPDQLTEEKKNEIIRILKPKSQQTVLFSSLRYDVNLKGEKASMVLNDLMGKPITLVTGIARPKPLVDYLDTLGLQFEHLQFKDHHFFSAAEIRHFNTKDCVLTTEKDYVRLKDKVENLFYISVGHRFLGDGALILEKVINEITP